MARVLRALPRSDAEQEAAHFAVRDRLDGQRRNLIPQRGQLGPEERVSLFTEMALTVRADVERLVTLSEIPASVAGYLRQHNIAQRVVVAPDPALAAANWDSQPLLRVHFGTAANEDAASVTLAVGAAAETGTLLLASSPDRPALLAFLPETSIIVLPTDRLMGAYEDAWQYVADKAGELPRSVNLITGPSRTADIAQQLELGAHGPRRLLILIVDRLDA